MNFIKKHLKSLIILIVLLMVLGFAGIFITRDKNPYKNEGFKGFYYRTYSKGKWSKWCKNGEICGKKGQAITDIQIKKGDSVKGDLLYNVYQKDDFVGLNLVSVTLVDNSTNIEGLILSCSGDIFDDYTIYYRTYNKKYGWLGYTDAKQLAYGGNAISGAKGQAIEQVQIIVLKNGSKKTVESDTNNEASYNFDIENDSDQEIESQIETENAE